MSLHSADRNGKNSKPEKEDGSAKAKDTKVVTEEKVSIYQVHWKQHALGNFQYLTDELSSISHFRTYCSLNTNAKINGKIFCFQS